MTRTTLCQAADCSRPVLGAEACSVHQQCACQRGPSVWPWGMCRDCFLALQRRELAEFDRKARLDAIARGEQEPEPWEHVAPRASFEPYGGDETDRRYKLGADGLPEGSERR